MSVVFENHARLEEYTRLENGLPCILHTHLQRTKDNLSKIANWHENLEIQYCTNGKGWVLLNGEKFAFEKGDIVIANSGFLHYTATDEYLEYSCLIIDAEFCHSIGVDLEFAFPTLVNSSEMQSLFLNLQTAYLENSPLRTLRVHACLSQLLYALCLIRTDTETPDFSQQNMENIKTVIAFIRKHFHEKLILDELAKVALCDKYQLTRIFKRATGQTIVTFINRLRCQHAANCIANGESVTSAALACGFENFSYFSKTFQAVMGKLPSAYKPTKKEKAP